RRVFDHHFGKPDDGIKRCAQFVAHAGDELRLVLASLLELPVLLLDLLEQPHVLDRDHRLVGKGGDKLDLPVGERRASRGRVDRSIEQEPRAVFADAAELVRWNADVLVAVGPEVSLKAAIAATSTIPIVIVAFNYDPIAHGYVKGLARSGGHITGVFL